ncbi:MAG TPA: DUF4156 domain-containing protein [Rhodanobacteraceae bacterium]
MRTTVMISALAAAVLLGGCSWGIKLTDTGRLVRTDWNGPMTSCQRLAKITVSVADHVGPLDRNAIKVRDELEVLARNQAATMANANTVHPLTQPSNGSQVWGAYRCGAEPAASTSATSAPAASSSAAQIYPIKQH